LEAACANTGSGKAVFWNCKKLRGVGAADVQDGFMRNKLESRVRLRRLLCAFLDNSGFLLEA